MGGESHIAGSVSRHKVNVPKRKSEGILLDSGAKRLSFFALSLLQGEYLIHWGDDMPEDVVFVYVGIYMGHIAPTHLQVGLDLLNLLRFCLSTRTN